jgi:DNA-binding NarL/FixJ family response regulator
MLESKASKDIADQLAMSIRTVEFHRSNIMKKMEADSPIDLGRMDAMAFGCYCVRNL